MTDPAHVNDSSAAGLLVVDDGLLAYDVRGEGAPVVLIHGGFGDRRTWDALLPTLGGLRVARYDHRGFGESSAPVGPYSPVADLMALLDHLGIGRVHLVGASMGGSLALDAAVLRPERVRSVVLVSAGPNGFPISEAARASVAAVFEAARTEGPAAAAERWLRHPMVETTMRSAGAGPHLRAMVEANAAIFTMRHWPVERLVPPAAERLAAILAPTLVVVGREDVPLVHAMAGAAAEGIPAAELALVDDADHLPHMARPDVVGPLLRDFLARH